MASSGVPHQWPNDQAYLGWIELAVRDEGVIGDLLTDAATDETRQPDRCHSHLPVREIYTIISAGRPTEVGLRGYPAVQTVIAAGAGDQRTEAVLNLLYGDAVRGLDQLRRRT